MIQAPRIDTVSLSHAYGPGIRALQDVSITLEPGAFTALIGRNGSGKTTLAKHLNGLLRPTEGKVAFDGADIQGRPIGELAAIVGYVFQNPDHQIFSPTVREELEAGPRNLGLSEAEIRERVEDTMMRFELSSLAARQPAMLDYGLRRLVSVAAVYSMRTPVLILDEPTTGLDWRGTQALMRRINDLHREGRTIIIITHDMQVVMQYAPLTMVLDGGRLVRFDRTSRVFQDISALSQMGIRVPPVVELGDRMAQHGIPPGTLTVEGFLRAWASRTAPKEGH
jgi:energy-coupling factor transport system ATP-binding protein